MTTSARRLGFWSAILSAASAVTWFITYGLQDVLSPVPSWQDTEAYARAFSPLRTLYIYPSLLLAVAFVVLLACLHRVVREEDKVWTLSALSLGIVYAAMATINYNIQAVAVRMSLASGATAGIEPFLPDNPNSVFTALANSYVYMALAMILAGFAFRAGGLERAVRWLFFAQAITVVGQVGWSMFGVATSLFLATSLVWVVGAPVAFVLIAILFRRAWRREAPRGATRGFASAGGAPPPRMPTG